MVGGSQVVGGHEPDLSCVIWKKPVRKRRNLKPSPPTFKLPSPPTAPPRAPVAFAAHTRRKGLSTRHVSTRHAPLHLQTTPRLIYKTHDTRHKTQDALICNTQDEQTHDCTTQDCANIHR